MNLTNCADRRHLPNSREEAIRAASRDRGAPSVVVYIVMSEGGNGTFLSRDRRQRDPGTALEEREFGGSRVQTRT